jgi:hypothetical protein
VETGAGTAGAGVVERDGDTEEDAAASLAIEREQNPNEDDGKERKQANQGERRECH